MLQLFKAVRCVAVCYLIIRCINVELMYTLSILMVIFPGKLLGAKDDGSGGDNWSCKTCRNSSQIVTTNKPTPNILQAGCHFCRPTNSVKSLKGNEQITLCKQKSRVIQVMACCNKSLHIHAAVTKPLVLCHCWLCGLWCFTPAKKLS